MDKRNHIDDLFRSKLEGYSPEYVPEHWQMMKSALENTSKVGGEASSKSITSILLIISAFIIVCTGIYTYTLSEKLQTQYNKNQTFAQSQTLNCQQAASLNQNRTSVVALAENSQKAEKANSIHANSAIEANHPKTSNPTTIQPIQKSTKKNITVKKNLIQTNVVANSNALAVSNVKTDGTQQMTIKSKVEYEAKPENVVADNIVVNNANTDIQNQTNANATVGTGNDKGLSEAELNPTSSEENSNYTSVTEDYLAKKQNKDAKHFKNAALKAKNASENSKANMEAAPDYKVSVVNSVVSNPAFAGFNQKHTVVLSTIVHKPMFKPASDFTVPFEYGIAYDFNFGKKNNYGLGINYKRYVGGAEGSLDVDLTFAYRFYLAKDHYLRVGVSASYFTSGVNFAALTFPDMIDRNKGFVYNTNEVGPGHDGVSKFDLGLGLWYSWKSLYVGVSASHLTSPNVGLISNSRLPREFTLSSGYSFKLNKSVDMLPAVELKYNAHTMNFTPNMLFAYNRWLLFGLEFQNLKTAGLVLGCNIKNNFILNLHGGVPMSKDLMDNFGIVDYAGVSLRFQFGKTR